jgi:phosphoglycolate phosphatase-like HAD superfamily hydrolase
MNNKLINIQAIFWDFDGVIMASNAVRDRGFEEVLKDFPSTEVEQLMDFHRQNGGLSRYVKFRYFFEEIRKESISDEEVKDWAARFSNIMRGLLVKPELLIPEILNYIKQYYKDVPMYIVSGSDQEELRYLCDALGITRYFKAIHGSPTPKVEWVRQLINDHVSIKENCFLVGDSINDKQAANENGIDFFAYNSDVLINEKQFENYYLND